MRRQNSRVPLIQCILLSSFLAVSLSGCLIRPDVDPEKLTAPPNTFAPGSDFIEVKKVFVVEVWDDLDSGPTLVWKIESKFGVPAKNFTITVGEVPDGFVQTIPETNGRFPLVRGRKYRIMIWTDHWPTGVDPRGTMWVAE